MTSNMPITLPKLRLLAFAFLVLLLTACGSTKKTATDHHRTTLTRQQRNHFAKLMDVEPRQITNSKLYLFIDEWWGVKYKYGGNTKEGIDCSGLVHQLYKAVYGLNIMRTSLSLYENSKLIRNSRKLDEGDLVFFATTNDLKKVSHVGVYLMNDRFVHAPTKGGVNIANMNDDYWKERWLCGGRVRQ